MSASPARWIIRGLLVLVIVGLLWIGYRSYLRSTPDFYWSRAQSALKAGELGAVKIHLQNMVQKFPKDHRGYRALAAALIEEAKLPASPAGYAAHPQALNMLAEAGKLREDDIELQKLLVSSYLRAGRAAQAAAAGKLVTKVDKQHADSIFAQAWQAAEANDSDQALRLIEQLPGDEKTSFRALGLKAQVLQARDAKDPELQTLFDAISQRAGELSSDELSKLSVTEFTVLSRLFPAAVAGGVDVAAAHRRADAAIATAEKLADTKSPNAKPAETMAAQVSAILTAKFPVYDSSSQLAGARAQLAARLQKLLPAGPPTDENTKTEMVVAHEAAQLAFNRGEYAQALGIVEAALAQHKADKRARPEEAQPLHFLAARALLGLQRHREAKEHLTALLDDKRTSGLGQLMLGAVASSEGRHQDALAHLTRAERELGPNPLVRVSLAQTLLALAKWEEVLPRLAELHTVIQQDDPEVQAWVAQQKLTDHAIHLQEARALLALKRYPEAQAQLAKLAGSELEPQGVELEAAYLTDKGQLATAEKLLADAAKKFPQYGRLIDRRAAILHRQGKSAEAQQLLVASAAAAPDDLRLQLLLAREYGRSGRHDEALALLAALEQKNPQSLPVLLVKSDALIQAGKLPEAMAVAEQIQAEAGGAAMGSMIGAVAALRAKDPKAAAAALKASAEKVPDNLQIRHLEGEVAAVSGNYSEAIAALGESIHVTSLRNRAGPLLCFCVAKLAMQAGPQAAEQSLMPLVAAMPDEPFLLVAYSDVLAMQSQFNAALKQLDRLEQLEKESALAPYLKAVVLGRAGDAKAALIDVNRALGLDPTYIPALALAAQLQFTAKDYKSAIENLDVALRITPKAWQLGILKIECQWAAGDNAAAIATARTLANQLPEQIELQRQLILLQARDKQYDAALADCRAAREKSPDDAALGACEVVLLALEGKPQESQQAADRFVGQPIDAAKAFALAQGFAQFDNQPEAKRWALAALTTAKAEQQAGPNLFLGNMAMQAHAATGNKLALAEARDYFAAVLKVAPRDFIAGNNLAWLLATEFGKAAEAVRVVEQTRGTTPIAQLPITFIDTMAEAYRRAGEFQKASDVLEAALAAHPEENLLKFHLGMSLGHISRAPEARQLLKEVLAGTLSAEQDAAAKAELDRLAAVEAQATEAANTTKKTARAN